MGLPTDINGTQDVLFRIKRGISAYVSYLAACEMNEAFSEYILYEPILRILTARGYVVKCEYECPGIENSSSGDKKRIDFYCTKDAEKLAIEVKWVKSITPNIVRDLEKLRSISRVDQTVTPLICFFGKKSFLNQLRIDNRIKEKGSAVYADLRNTKFGCRIFTLNNK